MGLNNLRHTDFVNVVLHALSHVTPVRDFFLQPANYANCKSVLVHKFGEVLRKLWSPHNFKSIVSPQELLHEISVASKKRFNVGTQVIIVHYTTRHCTTIQYTALHCHAMKSMIVINKVKDHRGLVVVTNVGQHHLDSLLTNRSTNQLSNRFTNHS